MSQFQWVSICMGSKSKSGGVRKHLFFLSWNTIKTLHCLKIRSKINNRWTKSIWVLGGAKNIWGTKALRSKRLGPLSNSSSGCFQMFSSFRMLMCGLSPELFLRFWTPKKEAHSPTCYTFKTYLTYPTKKSLHGWVWNNDVKLENDSANGEAKNETDSELNQQ